MTRRPVLIISSLIIIVIALSITRIVVSNSFAENGVQLVQIQQEIKDYDTQNTSLKQKLYTIASLDYIASRAASMGFVEDKTSYIVSKPQTIAQSQ